MMVTILADDINIITEYDKSFERKSLVLEFLFLFQIQSLLYLNNHFQNIID